MDTPFEGIASEFVAQYERCWNAGDIARASQLYAADAALVGASITRGRSDVQRLLETIYSQGWTTIRMKVLHVVESAGAVFLVVDYSAEGVGGTVQAKSIHVLANEDGRWRSVLHVAG
jgi:ketosteroid isomerase-like protein